MTFGVDKPKAPEGWVHARKGQDEAYFKPDARVYVKHFEFPFYGTVLRVEGDPFDYNQRTVIVKPDDPGLLTLDYFGDAFMIPPKDQR